MLVSAAAYMPACAAWCRHAALAAIRARGSDSCLFLLERPGGGSMRSRLVALVTVHELHALSTQLLLAGPSGLNCACLSASAAAVSSTGCRRRAALWYRP